uniref:FBD domain-containing protein n=1 Tax=Leersia perrieri TaxID=77586 RepID=A0A0D9X8N7_9ORYZ
MASSVRTEVLGGILKGLIHVERLEFDALIDKVDCDSNEVDAGNVEGFANAKTSDDIFPRLRYVWLLNISCSSNEMCFVKFVLSKAKSLELLFVRVSSQKTVSYEEACIKMAKYKRSSPLAGLKIIRGDSLVLDLQST